MILDSLNQNVASGKILNPHNMPLIHQPVCVIGLLLYKKETCVTGLHVACSLKPSKRMIRLEMYCIWLMQSTLM